MPLTTGALRKQRADFRKAAQNTKTKVKYRSLVSKYRKKPTTAQLPSLFAAVDRAAKRGVVHKNKAARLKSRLSRLVSAK